MKIKFILFLSLYSAEALSFSLFGNPAIDSIIGNLGNVQFGHSRGQISRPSTLDSCLDAIEVARSESGSQSGLVAAYLTRKITDNIFRISQSSHSSPTSNFGGGLNVGLDKSIVLEVNSYNPRFAPHLKSGCMDHTEILGSEILEFKGRNCLGVNLEVGASATYQMIYCSGSFEVVSLFN